MQTPKHYTHMCWAFESIPTPRTSIGNWLQQFPYTRPVVFNPGPAWGPTTLYILCLSYLTHLIQIISLLGGSSMNWAEVMFTQQQCKKKKKKEESFFFV